MKISILERDSLGIDVDMSEIDKLGEVTVYPATTVENAVEHIGDADIIIANKLPLNEKTLKDAKNLKFIAQTATGTNNIDFSYTNAKGIGVANVPSYSTDSVAQHTFSLLLYLVEKMRYFDDYVKNGTYSKSNCFSCLDMIYPEIAGKTWGLSVWAPSDRRWLRLQQYLVVRSFVILRLEELMRCRINRWILILCLLNPIFYPFMHR